MADTPDTGGWARYPTMTPPVEVERPADPRDLARFPSMPNGRVADKRLVPRHPPADEPAAPAGQPEADQALRARYPTMFEADVRPTEPDPAPAAEAATPAEVASGTQPEAPAEVPEPYRDLAPPEGLEVDTTALAAVAPDLQRLGVTREQATGLVAVLAKLEAQADAAVTAAQTAWRQEAAALPAATLADARSALKGAPPELLRVIEASRIGDHPAVIAWFARLRGGGGTPVDDAELAARKRFPNTRWN